MFDHKAKVLSRVYWQYKNAPKLLQWLLILPDICWRGNGDYQCYRGCFREKCQ
ncbi:Uncharacterised protein [Serratia entomophila]|nr:Uncharacterised protein [Serratia entomophila]CAI0793094.1 Uncharacterised protein [Serratia entomophila]CAI0807762.1 Uncharacterised protein [Serratia entomophila]CAI0815596.1 Uncharacterised protein [Serratia entomophila]CAI0836739.1 Uncharacterised protein [Serratia entomophila]